MASRLTFRTKLELSSVLGLPEGFEIAFRNVIQNRMNKGRIRRRGRLATGINGNGAR
jgi:hypothetical protein